MERRPGSRRRIAGGNACRRRCSEPAGDRGHCGARPSKGAVSVIWYRHWLELRSTAVGLMTAAAVLGPFYFRRELLEPGAYRGNGYEANLLRPLIDSLEPLEL